MAEIRPFYDLPPALVTLSSLSVVPVDASEATAATPVVSEWTVGTPLRVRGRMELAADLDVLLEELGLEEGRLVASLVWQATGTRRSGCIRSDGGNAPEQHFDDVIRDPVDGELRVRAVLTVEDAVSDDPLAPVEPGTSVWETHERFYLSGSASRFPMVAVSFTEAGLGPHGALWRFDVDLTDLEEDPSVAMRLMVNEDHPRREDLLLAEPTELLAMVEWDIRRAVVEGLLDDEELARLPDVAEGTIGSFARQCLNVALGTTDLRAARAMRRHERSRFETLVRGGTLALPS